MKNKFASLFAAVIFASISVSACPETYEMSVTSSQSGQGGAYEQFNSSNWAGAAFNQASTITSNGNGYGNVTAFTNDNSNVTGNTYVGAGYASSTSTGNMYTGFTSGGTACGNMSFSAWGTMNLGSASYLGVNSGNFVGAEGLTSGSFNLTGSGFPLGVYGNGQLSQSSFTSVSLGATSFNATATTSSWASACPVKK